MNNLPLPGGITDEQFNQASAKLSKALADFEKVDHPAHYGGADNPYEAIKVIEAWELDFNLGTVVRYISRHGKKPGETAVEDLQKASWYLNREIENLEKKKEV